MDATNYTPAYDAGYWLATYPDYDQRLAAMAAYIAALTEPASITTSPLAQLALVPLPT